LTLLSAALGCRVVRIRTALAAFLAVVVTTSSACVLADNVREPSVSRFSFFDGWENEPYGLDAEPRHLEEDEKVECAPDQMVRHRRRPCATR